MQVHHNEQFINECQGHLVSVRTFSVMYKHTLCLQFTKSHIWPQVKCVVSLVIEDNHFLDGCMKSLMAVWQWHEIFYHPQIMGPHQYPYYYYYKALEIYTGYFDSLAIS